MGSLLCFFSWLSALSLLTLNFSQNLQKTLFKIFLSFSLSVFFLSSSTFFCFNSWLNSTLPLSPSLSLSLSLSQFLSEFQKTLCSLSLSVFLSHLIFHNYRDKFSRFMSNFFQMNSKFLHEKGTQKFVLNIRKIGISQNFNILEKKFYIC
jgi:hypothetical protein